MRRFAQMNFKITTTVDSELYYTPCYTQYGLLRYNVIRRMNKNFIKIKIDKYEN